MKLKKTIILSILILIAGVIIILSQRNKLNNADEKISVADNAGYYLPRPVLSITGDEEDFWGYEKGILVPGKLFDEYKEQQISEGRLTSEEAQELVPIETMDANFNHKEWIKKCSAKLTLPDNTEVFNEKVGLRISGNASRKLAQKSFVMIADKDEYGSKSNEFVIDLGRGTASYKKLRIHSCGQDLRETQFREQLIAAMAERCDMEPVREMMPVLVYINNKLYGIAHIENDFTDSYISQYYGIDKKNIEIAKGGISDIVAMLGFDNDGEVDFNDVANREKIESEVDIDNFLKYFAFNMVIGNADWPHNNVFMWRYTGAYDENIPETDGRYRFINTDVDVTFMGDEKSDPFDELNWGDTGNAYMFFEDLIEYAPYMEEFTNIIMDQTSVALDGELVSRVLGSLAESYGDSFRFAADTVTDETLKGYFMGHDDKVSQLAVRVAERIDTLHNVVYQYYNSGDGYNLCVLGSEGANIRVSSIVLPAAGKPLPYGSTGILGENFSSLRACNISTPVSADIMPGYTFDHWEVNGKVSDAGADCLMITSNDAVNGEVSVKLVLSD